MRKLAILAVLLAATPALAKPHPSKAHGAKERAVLACIDERTGPTGGLDLEDASKLCRSIARHDAKIAKLAKLAQQARDAKLPRLVSKATADCEEEVSIACEDTTERAEDHGECSDATLRAKHAFDICTKGGK